MKIEQLELDLWQSLETAAKFPQTADFPELCNALDQVNRSSDRATIDIDIIGAILSPRLKKRYCQLNGV